MKKNLSMFIVIVCFVSIFLYGKAKWNYSFQKIMTQERSIKKYEKEYGAHLKKLHLHEYEHYGSREERLTLDLYLLNNMKELEELALAYININDVSPLVNLQCLKYIKLGDTGIEDIEPLKNLENLSTLLILGNKNEHVKEQAKTYFKDLPYLEVSEEIYYYQF